MATVNINCPKCLGTGLTGTPFVVCSECSGVGTIAVNDQSSLATLNSASQVPIEDATTAPSVETGAQENLQILQSANPAI